MTPVVDSRTIVDCDGNNFDVCFDAFVVDAHPNAKKLCNGYDGLPPPQAGNTLVSWNLKCTYQTPGLGGIDYVIGIYNGMSNCSVQVGLASATGDVCAAAYAAVFEDDASACPPMGPSTVPPRCLTAGGSAEGQSYDSSGDLSAETVIRYVAGSSVGTASGTLSCTWNQVVIGWSGCDGITIIESRWVAGNTSVEVLTEATATSDGAAGRTADSSDNAAF